MGKLTQKLIIYLDQNFISEIAKVEKNPNVSPDYRTIFNLIHKGFIDEKIIVPRSFFHKIETHMAKGLTDQISKHQSYMGQISLHDEDTIETFQLVRAGRKFLGEIQTDEDWTSAYDENPDNRLRQFDITIKGGDWLKIFKQNDGENTKRLNIVQKNIEQEGVDFNTQYHREIETARKKFLIYNTHKIAWLFKNDVTKIKGFVDSDYFEIPKYKIYSKMWSHLLHTYRTRPIRAGDLTDIDIISTYLPYVDVLATDSFMAQATKDLKLDETYNTQIFSSTKQELKNFITYLDDYTVKNNPVNVPDVSIFVLSDDTIKKNSFAFFKKLGTMTMNDRGGWIEIYAFDDGQMPKYYDKHIGNTWPFYGLQDIKVIKIKDDMNIVEECKKCCRSKKFIIIDSYRDIPSNFKETLVKYCETGKNKILNYNIYTYN